MKEMDGELRTVQKWLNNIHLDRLNGWRDEERRREVKEMKRWSEGEGFIG